MSKIYGQIRPMNGSNPVPGTEACLVEVTPTGRPDGSAVVKYLSGPTVWRNEDGLLWTGSGLFDLRGKLLYRYAVNLRIGKGDTITAIL